MKTLNSKLNTNILSYPNIIETLKKEIETYLDLNNKEVSPGILWDTMKAVIRGEIISVSSYLKKKKIVKNLNT